MATLGDLMIRVGAEIDGFSTAMKSVIDQVDDMANQVADKLESISNVGSRMVMLGGELTAAFTVPLEEIGRRAIDVAAQFEQTEVAFTTLIGSAQAGKEMLMSLYQFAATTPFEIPTVLQGARLLSAMQFAPKDIVPIMRTVGDAAAGLGLGQDRLQLLLYHFGQIRSEGKLTNVVLREMGRDGIGAAEMIAEAMGKPLSEIKKLATAGEIDSTTAINALLKGMNEQFGGMMENQMGTLAGQWSNFKDQITLTAVAIGDTLLPTGKQLIQWAQEGLSMIRELAQWFGNLPAPIQAGALALAAMVAAVGPLLAALGGLAIVIPQILAALGPIAAALGIGTGAFLGWAAAIGAAVAALVSLGVWMSSHWEGVKAAMREAWSGDIRNVPKAFREADSADQARKADAKNIADAESTMHLKGADAFQITDQRTAWIEKHQKRIETYSAALNTLSDAYKRGAISADELAKAQARLDAIKNEKMPDFSTGEGKIKAPKVDRNALDALTGEHAHDEAALAFRKAEIEHAYQMAQPGSVDMRESAANAAAEQIAAAEQRKRELDQIALEELQKTQQNINEKLKLYRSDQAGHQALIEAKQKAEDKFVQTIQKNAFDLETIKKQANDRIAAEEQRDAAEREKRQQKEYEMALKTTDLKVQGEEKVLQQQIKQQEFEASMRDKRLQFELETGTLSKDQYLRLKQEQYDAAYDLEMDALAKERTEIVNDFAMLFDAAQTEEQKQQVLADYNKRIQPLNERQQSVQNKESERQLDTDLGIKKNNFQNVWSPVQNGFSSAIADMVKGTKTFQQAFQGMAVTVLGSWINSISQMASKWLTHLAQMGAQWVAHKAMELVVHTTTNQAKVASDAAAAAETHSISLASHLKQIMMAAKLAAAKAWSAVVGIPIVGPVLAPIAAAASFAGVMAFGAFSAEGGAVLPNQNSILFAHPQEMVLPKHISVGLQNLIASGGLSNAGAIMNQSQGGALSSSALQMIRNTAQADRGGNTHNYNGAIHYHAASGEKMTVDTFGRLFTTYVRQNNLKMA